jgi:hypothetical protein
MAQEELANLVEIAAAIEKRNEDNQRRPNAPELGNGTAHEPVAGGFSSPTTRLLYTKIPAKSSFVAVGHMATGLAQLLYTATMNAVAEKNLVQPFIQPLLLYIGIAAGLHILLGIATGFHAVRMRIPLPVFPTMFRTLCLAAAMGMTALALFYVSRGTFQKTDRDGDSLRTYYLNSVVADPAAVCSYMSYQQCSGFDSNCDPSSCPSTCAPEMTYATTCGPLLSGQIFRVLIVTFAIEVAESLVMLVDASLLWRLFGAIRMVRHRQPQAEANRQR